MCIDKKSAGVINCDLTHRPSYRCASAIKTAGTKHIAWKYECIFGCQRATGVLHNDCNTYITMESDYINGVCFSRWSSLGGEVIFVLTFLNDLYAKTYNSLCVCVCVSSEWWNIARNQYRYAQGKCSYISTKIGSHLMLWDNKQSSSRADPYASGLKLRPHPVEYISCKSVKCYTWNK